MIRLAALLAAALGIGAGVILSHRWKRHRITRECFVCAASAWGQE